MTRLKRRALFSVLALAGLVVLLGALHNLRAKQALRAFKAGLIAKGEKLTIEELTPPAHPEAQRAANDLMQASWQLRAGLVVPNNLPRAMGLVVPGKASVGSKQSGIGDANKTNTWDELAEDLKMNAAPLERIREALESPRFDININYKMGFNVPLGSLARHKSVAHWLSAATLNDLHAGRLNEAAANLNALLSLVNASRDERLIINQLVRIAIAAIGIPPTWEALQADGWTDAQLAGIQQSWAALEFLQPMEQALAMSRAMDIELFDRLRNSSAERRQWFSGNAFGGSAAPPGTPTPTNIAEVPDFALEWSKDRLSTLDSFARENAWRWLWSYDDELRLVQTLQVNLEIPRRARLSGSFASARSSGTNEIGRLRQPGGPGSVRYFVSDMIAPAMEKASAKAARLDVQRQMTVTAIALKRYSLRHGKPAPTLAALIPEFLTQMPMDLIDGQPLRYRDHADGSFLLYSVNDDGKDDGGDPLPTSPVSLNYYFGNGRDMVWPMPATAEEIAEVQAKEAKKNPAPSRSHPLSTNAPPKSVK
jgi:hypothetical protein